MKQIFKSAGNKAKQQAAQTAKQIGQELLEIPKQAAQEAVGVSQAGDSLSNENKPQDASLFKPPQKTEQEVQKRLDWLERELEDMKKKREMEKQQSEFVASEQKKKDDEEKQKRMKMIFEPPKRKLRMPSFGKKKSKGTAELLKNFK